MTGAFVSELAAGPLIPPTFEQVRAFLKSAGLGQPQQQQQRAGAQGRATQKMKKRELGKERAREREAAP